VNRSTGSRWFLLSVSVLALGLTTGCNADGSRADSGAAPATTATIPTTATTSPSEPTGSDSPTPGFDEASGQVTTIEPAFAVRTSLRRATICYEGDGRDLATIDYTWSAAADVEVKKVELIDPVGVRLVGTPVTVPPVNYGGRIDYGGLIAWKDLGRRLDGNRFVSWPGHESVDLNEFTGGQTGLFALHLRLAERTGSSHGVRVTYVAPRGGSTTYTAEARNDVTWKYVGPKGRCHN
jgi:hypothetical protein